MPRLNFDNASAETFPSTCPAPEAITRSCPITGDQPSAPSSIALPITARTRLMRTGCLRRRYSKRAGHRLHGRGCRAQRYGAGRESRGFRKRGQLHRYRQRHDGQRRGQRFDRSRCGPGHGRRRKPGLEPGQHEFLPFQRARQHAYRRRIRSQRRIRGRFYRRDRFRGQHSMPAWKRHPKIQRGVPSSLRESRRSITSVPRVASGATREATCLASLAQCKPPSRPVPCMSWARAIPSTSASRLTTTFMATAPRLPGSPVEPGHLLGALISSSGRSPIAIYTAPRWRRRLAVGQLLHYRPRFRQWS